MAAASPAPEVSVLMPYRDAADTLVEAMDSILAQRGVTLELLAIDDGSRDDGANLVAQAAARDARVVRADAGGVGIPGALEVGRRLARAPLLARMDADDVAAPERLARQVALLAGDARLGVVGCLVEAFPADAVGAGLRRYVDWMNGLVTPADHEREQFVEAPLCHPSVLLRREALDAVGGWRDVPWAEDYDLWLRLFAAGWRAAKVPAVLLRWRHHPGRATFTHARYAPERFRELKAAFLAPRLAVRGGPFTVWGAGPTGRRLARALEAHGARPRRFVDIDPRKIGNTARGLPVVAPDALERGAELVIVAVGALGARTLIRGALATRGFVEGEDFLCAS